MAPNTNSLHALPTNLLFWGVLLLTHFEVSAFITTRATRSSPRVITTGPPYLWDSLPPHFVRCTTDLKSSFNDNGTDKDRWIHLTFTEKVLVPVRLVFSIYLLLLLPAGIAQGRLCRASIFKTLPYEYMVFFGLLVIPRTFRFGTFARQAVTGEQMRATNKRDFLLFIASLVGSHWVTAFRCSRSNCQLLTNPILYVIRVLATVLVGTSGWTLGRSYDRVTRPHELVEVGPYGWVRHPIYAAYILFFGGSLIAMHGAVEYGFWLVMASVFYAARMEAEDQLLEVAFGSKFRSYKQKVPWKLFPGIY